MFLCDKCGLCCRNLKLSSLYTRLARGDGVCIYYDENTKLCSIYETRPILCNIDKMFYTYFSNKLTKEEYYKLNYEACKKLKKINK